MSGTAESGEIHPRPKMKSAGKPTDFKRARWPWFHLPRVAGPSSPIRSIVSLPIRVGSRFFSFCRIALAIAVVVPSNADAAYLLWGEVHAERPATELSDIP